MLAQADPALKDKGKPPLNPSKNPTGIPLNATSCEGFIPYNQGIEVEKMTKRRQEEIQEILFSQPQLENGVEDGVALERRAKRRQEQPVPPQITAPATPASSSSSSSSSLPIMV